MLEGVVELFPVLLRVVQIDLAQRPNAFPLTHGWTAACKVISLFR